jgi:F0F1-type ATP synthase assembly protein I
MGILEHCATQNMNHFRGRQYFIQLDMIDSYKVTTNINITIAVSINANFISGVMVSVLVSSAVDRGLACSSRVQ